MKATCPADAMTKALHEPRVKGTDYAHSWEPRCCGAEPHDRREALDLLDALGEDGWFLKPVVSLPETAPKGREPALELNDFTEQVLALFLTGPLDTFSLNTLYRKRSEGLPALYPKRAFDTPRKRLSELERRGLVRQVRDGNKQATRKHHGVPYGVWEITDAGRERVQTIAREAA